MAESGAGKKGGEEKQEYHPAKETAFRVTAST